MAGPTSSVGFFFFFVLLFWWKFRVGPSWGSGAGRGVLKLRMAPGL